MEPRTRGLRTRTIKAVLRRKFSNWLDSINDKELRNHLERSSYITGGSIASMLLGEQVNDFDIYFTDKQTAKRVAKYYIDLFNKLNYTSVYLLDGAELPAPNQATGYRGLNLTADRLKIVSPAGIITERKQDNQISDLETDEETAIVETIAGPAKSRHMTVSEAIEQNPANISSPDSDEPRLPYRPVCLSTNTISLDNNIQLIIRFYGPPEEVHKNFDFEHCRNYWLPASGELVFRPAALEAILTKELIYIGTRYPVASVLRMRKFIQKGWRINAGQILKIAYQISELDLNNTEVLEDQLIGVDVAFFHILIEALHNYQKDRNSDNIRYSYLAFVIDKLF
jgi:hypothetical protein